MTALSTAMTLSGSATADPAGRAAAVPGGDVVAGDGDGGRRWGDDTSGEPIALALGRPAADMLIDG
jgi:hypothetical protein